MIKLKEDLAQYQLKLDELHLKDRHVYEDLQRIFIEISMLG